MDKSTFILFKDYGDYMKMLSMEDRGVLLTAIFAYQNGEELPEMEGATAMLFSVIRKQFDRNEEAYKDMCQKRSEAGKQGGRPKTNAFSENDDDDEESKEKQKKQMVFSESKEKQTKAKKAYNEPDKDTDTEPDTEPEKDSVKGEYEGGNGKRFQRPELEEVAEYCAERGNSVDPQAFMDFYTSNGWKVGKNPMKDWRAAVRTWEREDRARGQPRRQRAERYDPIEQARRIAEEFREEDRRNEGNESGRCGVYRADQPGI